MTDFYVQHFEIYFLECLSKYGNGFDFTSKAITKYEGTTESFVIKILVVCDVWHFPINSLGPSDAYMRQ